MKNALQAIIAKQKEQERTYSAQRKAELENPLTGSNRRDF